LLPDRLARADVVIWYPRQGFAIPSTKGGSTFACNSDASYQLSSRRERKKPRASSPVVALSFSEADWMLRDSYSRLIARVFDG
jgi:hypothetical protein